MSALDDQDTDMLARVEAVESWTKAFGPPSPRSATRKLDGRDPTAAGRIAGAGRPLCPHTPACPSSDSGERDAARTVVSHPVQAWSLLCNGVIRFDDSGLLLPDGTAVPPRPSTYV